MSKSEHKDNDKLNVIFPTLNPTFNHGMDSNTRDRLETETEADIRTEPAPAPAPLNQ